MIVLAALCEFGVGAALFVAGIAYCMVRAISFDDRSSLAVRVFWGWAGMFWFGAVMLGTMEAIFHTLGVPLS